ncbi:hypothetical protein [Sphingobacterium sp. 18053]|uniref:hypothetical protein n=1 Tax=Sphingobacterium sp. 18053 TaxID=2681401 RepID=UPI00135C553B|nr:hypothetical protein [Sphingobacterium sp. 18053]
MKKTILVLLSFLLLFNLYAQNKAKVFIKEGQFLRLESNSHLAVDSSISILVPKNNDEKDKDRPKQDSIFKGKITIEIDGSSTVDKSNLRIPAITEFSLDSIKEEKKFMYPFRVIRDKKDDKLLILNMIVKNKDGKKIDYLTKKITVIIKPLIDDSLSTNNDFEFWILAGTNFDPFNGVKPQEFFFRANTLFKISDKFYGQIAFYKNRYFNADSLSDNLPFTQVVKPGLGDSLYTIIKGNYNRSVSQTLDPLSLQFDIMNKIGSNNNSNFFVTGGFDFGLVNVKIKNSYKLDTVSYWRTSQPDTIKQYNMYGSTRFPPSIEYKKAVYNINLGFMWILNAKDVNIKAHLTTGLTSYSNLISIRQSQSGSINYQFKSEKDIYLQLRLFATYMPAGISFGMESFNRPGSTPSFNFTLSKAFDIRGFTKNFTPVSGLSMSQR